MYPTDSSDPVEPAELLEAILVAAIADLDLADRLEELALPALATTGEPVCVTGTATFTDEGILTLDRGIVVRLSDGSQYTLTIHCYQRPDEITDNHVIVRSPRRRRRGGRP
jgi:hypothetical protein